MDASREQDIREFLAEAGNHIDEIEPLLISLGEGASGGEAKASVSTVFRGFHSIKGVSGFLSLFVIQEITHAAEELLQEVREDRVQADRPVVEALVTACDLLRKVLRGVADTGSDAAPEEEKRACLDALRRLLSGRGVPADGELETLGGESLESLPDDGMLFDFLRTPAVTKAFSAAVERTAGGAEDDLLAILDGKPPAGQVEECLRKLRRVKVNARALGYLALVRLCAAFEKSAPAICMDAGPVGADGRLLIFRALEAVRRLGRAPSPEEALLREASELAEGLDACSRACAGAVPRPPVPAAASPTAEKAEGPAVHAAASATGELRVNQQKLDRIIELIERLGATASSASLALQGDRIAAGGPGGKALKQICMLAESLQQMAISIRLVPLKPTFRKMARVISDVSSKLGKKVRLEVAGEETEVDKRAVEELVDPLVHIVRNAVDHGLEEPGRRAEAGKPETGTVSLQAWNQGGNVCISVSDDGRGLRTDRILEKAVSLGLCPRKPEDMSREEILSLILLPGFSTAEKITEVSGRGVGMDVVRQNILRMGGELALRSEEGKGTTVLITIPSENMLTECIMTGVGSSRYLLRLASVKETIRAQDGMRMVDPSGLESLLVRGSLYPLLRLNRLHGIPDAVGNLEDGYVCIVESRGERLALLVDRIIGKVQSAIKPFPASLGSVPGVSGFVVMGSESSDLGLVLDVNGLLEAGREVAHA
jgi:two-component system chemotaxis sensor kinase CheA